MKKTGRKIIASLLALVMTISLCPISAFATEDVGTVNTEVAVADTVDTDDETGGDGTAAETGEVVTEETGDEETAPADEVAEADTPEADIAAIDDEPSGDELNNDEPNDTDSNDEGSDDSDDDSDTTTEQGDIGEKLDGDYAYLSDVAMVADSTTTSGYAMRTGTSPWDDDDTAGNDSTDTNNSLRTYDIATYTVTFTSRVRDDAPYKFYYQGNLYFEFILQGDSTEVQFETGSMGWLDAKNATYIVTEETIGGEVCQVLRGYYSWQPASGNDHAIGESTQELTLAIRALAMSNGDTITPTFTFWLEGNQVGVDYSKWGTEEYEDGVVTGSNNSCPDHNENETEYQTITAPSIEISAKASYNIKIVSASATTSQTVGTFDFSTGNDLVLDRDAGSVYGRLGAYGIIIQIVGKDATSGLRGVELPKSGEGVQGTVTGGTLLVENDSVTVYDEDGNALYTVTLSLESNEDGTTTLTYTLSGVTSTSDLTQYLDTIHFSCEIGTEGNEETDVQDGDSLTASATVESTEDCNRDLKTANGNYSECGILISKNSASALSKFADQSVVEVGGSMGFTLNVANNSTSAVTVRAVEGLPYEGDGVSSFTGSLVVTEFRVYSSASAGEDGNYTYDAEEFAERYGGIKFYYTTNTDYRGKYSEDLQNEDFTDTANWTELTISADGTAVLPEGTFTPVAIVAVGTPPASTTLRMHISVMLPSGEGGDYVVNRLSNYNTTSLTSSARCRIISRALEGVAWYDANADGIQNNGTGVLGTETNVNGVKVELLKLNENGDATKESDYTVVAETTTGHQYDVQTGTETEYTTGHYYFTSLSAGTYAVRFTERTYSFTNMYASPVDQGTDDTIDSDAVATYTDSSMTKTVITDITMPDVSTLTYGSYVDRHHDSGFYCVTEYKAEDIVIDFGLPVDHTISGWDDSVSSLTGSATYGDVTVGGGNGWTVTYTPTTVLTGIDTVTLADKNDTEYTFKVYPATTVYYEEGFATYGTGWGVTGTGSWNGQLSVNCSTRQETEIANTANNSYNNYNYDGAYSSNTAASNGTVATGTVKMLTVDTSDIGSYNSGSVSYNTPIASVSDLTYGSYTVIIYVSTPDDGFIFDGFRVYDTCKNDTDAIAVYTTDLEDDPDYYELRNNVLAGLNVSTDEGSTIYASDIAKTTLAQVYATGTNNTSGAVVYYSSSVVKEGTDVQTLLDDGPKNELYRYPGMSVIFTINTSREVQIGLQSVIGESVSYGSTDTKTVTVY